MTDEPIACSCVIDCSGLCEVARIQSNNLKTVLLEQLHNGTIGVPAKAWREFVQAYPDEAADLAPYVVKTIRTVTAHRHNAARLAEKLNSGFSNGPYDQYSDIFTASVAMLGGYTILTAPSQIKIYEKLGCQVEDLVSWATDI